MTTGRGEPVVLDASALVALLAEGGSAGRWVATTVGNRRLVAPHLVQFECANVLRRLVLAGRLESGMASAAHADLLELPLELWPYEAFADRVWSLRGSITMCDASYAALADLLGTCVITLDSRMAAAPGLPCPVLPFSSTAAPR